MINTRRMCALLDSVDRLPVDSDQFRKRFLAQLALGTGGADTVPDGAAGDGHPLGQGVGWHLSTLAAALIIVCTIVGTSVSAGSGQDARTLRIDHSFD